MNFGDIQISDKLLSFLTFLPIFFISISVHEFAHALLAYKLGDDTAKNLGRLTLNPVKHADIVGTLIMPLASFASGFALIGWAKPVPVNRANFKNHLRDDAVVSFAGPFSNFILALIFFLFFYASVNWGLSSDKLLLNFFWYGVFLNIFLFAFNLLPFPPLDGSHILFDIFPNKFTAFILNIGFYGSIVLLLFIYSPLWKYFMRLVSSILEFFLRIAGIS
ncbi:MAG TPA: site-2 protease family protein [Ignavibacteriaceae bacterium]|nr:site-2 protease family protein [Ignavibacteriaceae bacterium]